MTPLWLAMRTLLAMVCCFLAILATVCAQRPRSPLDQRARAPAEKNPFETPRDVELGGRLFQTHCSYCHGAGEGGRGADLTTGQYRFGASDPELFTTVRNGIEGTEMGPVRATDDDVWRMVGFVKTVGAANVHERAPGDPAAGKMAYETKGGCPVCHVINDHGGNLGPELTDIGRRRGIKFLRESLLEPGAEVPINYRAVQVVTSSGETVAGIRLNEDDISIQLRDTGDSLRSFLKDNLKEIRRDRPSLMPAYGSILTNKQIEDVVAYLSTLRGER